VPSCSKGQDRCSPRDIRTPLHRIDDSKEVWWVPCRTAFGMYCVGLEMRIVALKGGVSAPLYLPAPGGKIESCLRDHRLPIKG
jgi:hypothetical protein